MAITYTPTTNFGAKDSLPTNDPDKVIKGSEFTTEFTAIQTAFGLAAPAASPTFTGTVTIASVDINGGTMTFGDNDKAIFGAGSDLQIYHDGSNSYIDEVGVGSLRIRGYNQVRITDTSDNIAAIFKGDAESTLYHNNTAKLSTTATGIDVTGVITTDGMTTSATVNFPDGVGAYFGTGNDLQIYHSGTQSIIADAGTGNLNLRGQNQIVLATASGSETYAAFNVNGASQLYYDNAIKLATTATGIDVTGTVTADESVVIEGTSPKIFLNETDTTDVNTRIRNAFGSFQIQSVDDSDGSPVTRLGIDHATGDISFYEDTGTTPKFFWDASAESLGIGNSFPSNYTGASANNLVVGTNSGNNGITIVGGTTGYASLAFADSAGAGTTADYSGLIQYYHNTDNMNFFTGGAERMRITSAGNVGIGTTTPTGKISATVASSGTYQNAAVFTNAVDTDLLIRQKTGVSDIYNSAGVISFSTGAAGGTERARIDSTGSWLVGGTNSRPAEFLHPDGFSVRGDTVGQIQNTVTSAHCGIFNRDGTDGEIFQFRKEGAAVGSIGTVSGLLGIGSGDAILAFDGTGNAMYPMSSQAGGASDGVLDFGSSLRRFKDLYRSGSTISTSDRNMKQDERPLTDAEAAVAQACKGLLKAFRFIDAVETDGDGACIHFGIIAQDLQAAFEAEGLDANNYAMFRPSTFTDDEGNEQTRLGVCYENLLAFIIAAL
jgi:hypothetical protein